MCEKIQRFNEIEKYLENSIALLSNQTGISCFDIEIMLRMMLPLSIISPFNNMPVDIVGKLIFERIKKDVNKLNKSLNEWSEMCGSILLKGCSPVYHKKYDEYYVYDFEGKKINLEFKDVDECVGRNIEKQVHYLHSFRKDAIVRKGLFIQGYSYPVLYMSVIKVCSPNKLRIIVDALELDDECDAICEVSRSIGCEYLPKNSISLMYSYIKEYLKSIDAKYIITAVNNFLGFNGLSIKASGFSYLIDRCVDYSYTDDLTYVGPLDKDINTHYYTDKTTIKNKLYYCKV